MVTQPGDTRSPGTPSFRGGRAEPAANFPGPLRPDTPELSRGVLRVSFHPILLQLRQRLGAPGLTPFASSDGFFVEANGGSSQ